MAQKHGPDAIKELARLAASAASEAARVSACEKILDRTDGKSQLGCPIQIELPDTSTAEGVSKAFASIVKAVSRPNLAARGPHLCGILESQRKAIELVDLDARLSALEKRLGHNDAHQ